MLWQGAPQAHLVALHVLHVRAVAGYFALAAALQFGTGLAGGGSGAWQGPVGTLLAGLAALGLLALLAWLTARTTLYTVTDRRVVLRFGIALPVTLNLPFSAIRSADLRRHRDGSGGIALALDDPRRVLYATLWPHARPWRLATPEPMLRALPDVDAVGRVLARALNRAQSARIPVRLATSRETLPTPAAA